MHLYYILKNHLIRGRARIPLGYILKNISKKVDIGYRIPFVNLDEADPLPFHIRHLDFSVEPDALKEEPHRHNFQELIWIKEGEGQHVIDNTTLMIEPHMFYLIAQGQVHYFLQGIGLRGNLIRFTDDFFFKESLNSGWDYYSTLFNLFAIRQSMKVVPEEAVHFEEIMDAMLREYDIKALGWVQLSRHLLGILLILLERTRSKMGTGITELTEYHHIHNTFISLLEQNYKQQHSVSYYARELYMSERQVSDAVRKISGKTPKRLILERIILEAKRYVTHTTMSIKEIAVTLGFDDPSYFGKIFKQITGKNPGSYR